MASTDQSDEQDVVTPPDAPEALSPDVMSVIDHLQELRKRLIKIILTVVIAGSCSYYFAADLIMLISQPVGKLYYMHPAEAFFTYMKVSFFVGFIVTLPITLYQVWAFILPALKTTEKKAAIFLVPASVLLFALGLAFSYFLALPAGIAFMLGFANDNLQPLFSFLFYCLLVLCLNYLYLFWLPHILVWLVLLFCELSLKPCLFCLLFWERYFHQHRMFFHKHLWLYH